MLTKEQKKSYISEITTQFENSKAVMVTHYQGLTMTQIDDLRAKMREHGIIFKITKNRITKLALEKTKCKDLASLPTLDEARANIVGILNAPATKLISILLAYSEKMSNLSTENSETQPKE